MSNENFDRQYRLIAGPAGQTGFEIGEVTPENPVPLHISFTFEKSDLTTQNNGKLTVWNLSPQHLSVLNQKDCVVALRAGYGNRISLIFAGVVSFVTTTIDSADRKTDIELVDNLIEIRDTYISVSYNGNVNWKTIIDDVADQMGVVVSYSYNASFVDIPNGYSYVGPAKSVLDKACSCCGLSWSIQNGVLQVKRKGDTMSNEVYVLSSDSGLLGIPARVSISADEGGGTSQKGWDVEYFMNGAINVDDFVRLETKDVKGYFRVYSIQVDGDNVSGDWFCKARLLEVT